MDLEEYHTLLAWHDWAYPHNSDKNVKAKGDAARRELEIISEQSPRHKAMFEKFLTLGNKHD